MPSCFKCAVIDQLTGTVEAIGVCAKCSSLACYDHGTRLRQGRSFRCALCLSAAMLNAAGIVQHEDYTPPPPGSGGSVISDSDPDPGSGGGGGAGQRLTHAEFELSPLTTRIAAQSERHRVEAARVVEDLVALVLEFADAPQQAQWLDRMAVTSDPTTRESIRDAGMQLSRELRRLDNVDAEIIADALGVARWASGAAVDGEIPIDRIGLIADSRIDFMLRAWSRIFVIA